MCQTVPMAHTSETLRVDHMTHLAMEVRRDIFRTIYRGGGGHVPASLSIVEILTVLYEQILRIDPYHADDPNRDRFILSKGHAAVALYVILSHKGFFDRSLLDTFGKKGTILGGHPDMHKVPGVEATTGALGHGFAFGLGLALAGKMDGAGYRVFTLLGDGECQEGSIWEAALFAPHHHLDNLVAMVDYNQLQAMDRLDKIIAMGNLADKWRSFGWETVEIDGHNIQQVQDVLGQVPLAKGRPTCIIAHTVKGKGIRFMENAPLWHYRMPNAEELKIACEDLGLKLEEVMGR